MASTSAISGFSFNRVIIIKSLDAADGADTATITSQFIRGLISQKGIGLSVDVITCSHAGRFRAIMRCITKQAKKGLIPLLHIECHGDEHDGLEFENGSTLGWSEVSDLLLPINIATRFNLLAVFSACFGAHFIGQMSAIQAAPCWCVIAPTEKIYPDEILRGHRAFYSTLFKTMDVGQAVMAISRNRLMSGRWFWKPAELWFESILTEYIKNYCDARQMRARARRIYRETKANRNPGRIGRIIRSLRDENRRKLSTFYFEVYFIVNKIPENSYRFANARRRINRIIEEYREDGNYFV